MTFIETIADFFEKLGNVFSSFSLSDALDILLVTFLIYGAIKLLRDTRAIQLVKGIVLIGIIYLVIIALDMNASQYIFQSIFSNIVLVLLILFQPEIRHAFESLGRSNITKKIPLIGANNIVHDKESIEKMIGEVIKAAEEMSAKKVGALIAFERGTLLGEIAQNGTQLDAIISRQLLENIFYPKSPLHDGAIVVRGDRVVSAGCILPLTSNPELSTELGTRHRAAIGLSEESDALILVVSEETGAVSYAIRGELYRDVTMENLENVLTQKLSENTKQDTGLIAKLRGILSGLKSDGKDVG
ncbi:MAG: diadenylate cyclase CdaA [Clostridia bacterium]|nr:diadenylate cyclase CdaA [Clostridia bacterium]